MGSTHLKAYKTVPAVQLVAVASDQPSLLTGDLSGVQGNIGGPGEKLDFSGLRRYTDALEAVRDPEVEAVDLCLPTYLHEPVAIEALRHGKHVLVEKPLALDGESADRIVFEAERQGRILMAAQVLRFWPAYAALAEVLKGGTVGHPRSAIFRRRCAGRMQGAGWVADAKLSGGGAFDLLIHDVDMCLHLFGPPQAISAWGYEDPSAAIDVVTAQLHYPAIGSVTVTGGWHHPRAHPFSMEYTVVADGGTVEFHSASGPPALYNRQGQTQVLPATDGDGYAREIQYFVDCATSGRQPAACPPGESAIAVKLTRLMIEARRRNGEKLACDL